MSWAGRHSPWQHSCGQQLPQAPGHLLHLRQQLLQQAGLPSAPRSWRRAQRGGQEQGWPGVQGGPGVPGSPGAALWAGSPGVSWQVGDHGREGWPSTLGRGAPTVLCPPGQGITRGTGRCAQGWVWRQAQGQRHHTELAWLWPGWRWRPCRRCSCCWRPLLALRHHLQALQQPLLLL